MFMQKFIKIIHSVQEIGLFSLFQNLNVTSAMPRAMPRPIPNDIWQPLGLHLVNINAYAKFDQNIPNGLRVIDTFREQAGVKITFLEFEPRQRLGQSQMKFDNLLGYILSISVRMQNIIKRFKSYRHFSRTGRRQNLHKLSGDKIKCLIIGHS